MKPFNKLFQIARLVFDRIHHLKFYKKTGMCLGLFLTATLVVGQEQASKNEATEEVKNFFTVDSLTTLSAAILMVYVATNVLKLLNLIKPLYLSMLLSFLIVLIGAIGSGKLVDVVDYALVFFNGCLLFTNALGINEATNALNDPGFRATGSSHKGWVGSWVS